MSIHFWLNQEAISSYQHQQAIKVYIIKAISVNTHMELMEGVQATALRLRLHQWDISDMLQAVVREMARIVQLLVQVLQYLLHME